MILLLKKRKLTLPRANWNPIRFLPLESRAAAAVASFLRGVKASGFRLTAQNIRGEEDDNH